MTLTTLKQPAARALCLGMAVGLLLSLITAIRTEALPPQNGPEMVSVSSTGEVSSRSTYPVGISVDGRYAAFVGSGPVFGIVGKGAVMVRDRQTATTEMASVNSDEVQVTNIVRPRLSGDGRHVIFSSNTTNIEPALTPQDEGNYHLYVRYLDTGTTERVSFRPDGSLAYDVQDMTISDDGQVVAFAGDRSLRTNRLFVRDITAGQTVEISFEDAGYPPAMLPNVSAEQYYLSGNGRFLFYTTLGDTTDPQYDGYRLVRYDRTTGTSQVITQTDIPFPTLRDASYDGDYVLTTGNATKRFQVSTGQALTIGDAAAGDGTMTGDGQLISFTVTAPSGQYRQLHVYDATLGTSYLVSRDASGAPITLPIGGDSYISNEGTIEYAMVLNPAASIPVQQVYVAAVSPPDTTAPTITPSLSAPANAAGWHNTDVTVSFTCQDNIAIAACSSPVTVSTETAGQSIIGTATDTAGNTATAAVTIKLDKTMPAVSSLTVTPGIILFAGTLNIAATASDALSGIARAEYYIDTDPGQGNGTTMAYNSSTGAITAAQNIPFGSMSTGQHQVYVRVQDTAGNWSTLLSRRFIKV
jgi:hypothetical protein